MKDNDNMTIIHNKDGIKVYRVINGLESKILKTFDKHTQKTEILWYEILNDLQVKTLEIYEYGDSYLMMEDINDKNGKRLGVREDLNDTEIVRMIARAFKCLHDKSIGYFNETLPSFQPQFELDKVKKIKQHINNDLIQLLEKNIEQLNELLSSFPKVIIHRDFFYTNYAVDDEEVILFDFNQMCLSLRSVEIEFVRRVIRNHYPSNEFVFMNEYGEFDEFEYEIYKTYNHIDCLYYAFQQNEFPRWGEEALKFIKNNDLQMLEEVINNRK